MLISRDLILEARSLYSKKKSSLTVRATIHPSIHPSECGRASWGRVVAGYAPNSPAPPPDYSFLDRASAQWRSESSTIQDTDQRRPELGGSQEASLKI